MKKIFGLIVWLGVVSLAWGQDLDKRVSLAYQAVPLEKVLGELEGRYGLRFSYSADLIDLRHLVSIHVREVRLKDALASIFQEADMAWLQAGDQIVLQPRPKRSYPWVFKGKIVDQTTGEPLPMASVRLEGTPLGTLANHEGEFLLNVPERYSRASATLSFIGYVTMSFSLDQPSIPERFTLQEMRTTLSVVTVTARTGQSVMKEAIARISENYDTGRVIYTCFIRDMDLHDGIPMSANEAVYQAYRGAGKDAKQKQIKVLKGRQNKDFGFVQRVLQAFPRWTGFDINVDKKAVFLADLSAQEEDQFPNAGFLKRHDFELLGTGMLHGGQEVYVVAFDQKDAYKNKSLYKGKFYIDTESLAFVRIESELSPKGIRHARFFNTSRSMALLFGYSRCATLRFGTIINYKPWNGKWYPANLEAFWKARVETGRNNFSSEVELNGDIVVTDIQTGDVKPFDVAEVVPPGSWDYMYKLAYWDGYNAVPPDTQMEDAFETIALANRRQGIDMKFWRRFQPYKSHPEYLERDSIANQQSRVMEAPVLNDGNDDELLHPRYRALDRTWSSKHFVMHYVWEDSLLVQAMASILEQNYDRVLADFGMRSLAGPVHAEIYPDIEQYHFAIGKTDAPASDAGMAVDDDRFMMVSPGNPGTYHTTETLMKGAVHEFAHCVHYQFLNQLGEQNQQKIGEGGQAPWLFESMASFEAGQNYDPRRFEYLRKGQYPTLAELNDVEGNGRVYDVGFVLIQFIERTWGKEKVRELLRVNGDTTAALGMSEAEFEERFYGYLQRTFIQ